MLWMWALLAAVVVVQVLTWREIRRIWRTLMALQDKITAIQTDLDALVAEVTAAVADIAALKAQIGSGEVVTQEELDALDAIGTRLTTATADLHAGE